MALLPKRGFLAVAAVLDIALQGRDSLVSSKTLAARHSLPPRNLEPILQALVSDGILKGVRGPRGGYYLARHRDEITVGDVLRAAGTLDDEADLHMLKSGLVNVVIRPAVAKAEKTFATALSNITIEHLARRAKRGDG
jgi:Rrf2 family protein